MGIALRNGNGNPINGNPIPDNLIPNVIPSECFTNLMHETCFRNNLLFQSVTNAGIVVNTDS